MTENNSAQELPEDLPEAAIEEKSGLSLVWLIPIIALLIGGWLVYKAISEKGPTITITFKTAEGLEAGKTKVKFKDVEVGQVESIDLSEDLNNVTVTAELHPEAQPYLTDATRFWVERARIAAGRVSGLGTLFSGAFIAMDPSKEGTRTRRFVGLETPPAVTSYESGRHFTLHSKTVGSLEVGSPIYYRKIRVGEVDGYILEESGESVTIDVFINEPYFELIRENTRFWNASGLDVSLTADGLQVDTDSFVSMLIGGIAFDTPAIAEVGGPVEEGQVFTLYESRSEAFAPTYVEKQYYYVYFQDSVRGLNIGAPVELRGIKIGEVKDIKLEGNLETLELRIPVLIEIEPQRIVETGERKHTSEETLGMLVKRGLRAQLSLGNLVTGQQVVALDFHRDAPPAEVGKRGTVPVVPTIPTPFDQIKTSATELLNKLARLPLDQIGEDLRETVAGLNQTVNSAELKSALVNLDATLKETQRLVQSINSKAVPALNTTLEDAQKTATSIRELVSAESPVYTEILRTLRELSDAARSIRLMTDYLERHPEALIHGKGGQR